jgi:hypothetical protein
MQRISSVKSSLTSSYKINAVRKEAEVQEENFLHFVDSSLRELFKYSDL